MPGDPRHHTPSLGVPPARVALELDPLALSQEFLSSKAHRVPLGNCTRSRESVFGSGYFTLGAFRRNPFEPLQTSFWATLNGGSTRDRRS
jgi:hypothetical protein